MAKQEVLAGQTDYTVLVFIPDSASTDGSGKTGLVAANLTVSYVRVETDNDVTVTDVTSSLNNLALLTTVHTDWGLLEVSNTLAPGLYRLDIADAVFATGAWSAVVYVMVTTSASAASPMEFMLVPNSPLTGVLLAPTTHTSAVIPTVTTTGTATAVTTVNGLAANVITAASMAADASAEIADAVWDEDATGHQTQGTFGQAIGDPVADTNTIYAAVVTGATGTNIAADIVALKTAVDDIPTSAESAEIQDIVDAMLDEANASHLTAGSVGLAISTGGTAAGLITTLTTEQLEHFQLTLLKGAHLATDLADAITRINANTGTGAGTFDNTTDSQEAIADAAGGSAPTAADIADAVWDEAIAGHLTGGTTGAALNGAGSAGDPWTTPLPGAYGAGTAGKIIGDNINGTISSRASQTSVDGAIADTEDIQSRLPAALTGAGLMQVDVIRIDGEADTEWKENP